MGRFQPTPELIASAHSELMVQVLAGQAWLDANHPGWADRVNVDALDIGSCATCMIAQLEPERDFNLAAKRLGYSALTMEEMGFFRGDGSARVQAFKYKVLTNLWIEAIMERRTANHARSPDRLAA